jgi:hypothetical protein
MSKLLKLSLMIGAATVVLVVPAFAGTYAPVSTVPEPSTLAMLALGMGAIAALCGLRKR